MRKISTLSLFGALVIVLLSSSASFSQINQPKAGDSKAASENLATSKDVGLGGLAETLWQKGEAQWKNSMLKALATDEAGLVQFLEYNKEVYYKDRGYFFQSVMKGLNAPTSIDLFFSNLQTKYAELYRTESTSPMRGINPLPTPQATCNPSCFNINFQSGTLSGWSGYYAVDNSTSGAISIGSKTGGACGAVTQAGGPDPNTGSTYHVQLLTTPGSDPVAGGFIPYAPPLGGLAVRIGDGTNNGYGVGILEQTYLVDIANPILTVQYAVVLENPGHSGYEQPWFRMEVLDGSGNPIPGCGQYFVVAGPGLPGFRSFYNATNADTVYCRPWTTAFVPLNNYVGQCVTVRFTASDCALGGHFGYAYVAATCTKLNLISSSTVFCVGQQTATITGPAGAASYKWSTAGGCISGSSTQQSVSITCGGTYSVITQSSAGAQCVDTFSVSIPNVAYGPPPTPCFSATRVCSGNPTAFNAACSTAPPGSKYYWDFYNNGQINDSSGATPSYVFTSGGYYTVRLHLVAPNGCSSDTVMTIPVDSSSTYIAPTFTTTVTNATSCSACDGKVTYTVGAIGPLDQVTTSFDSTVATAWVLFPLNVDSGANYCGFVPNLSGGMTLNFCGLCPGTHYIYYKPLTSPGPSVCNPNGPSNLAAQFVIGGTNVTITSNFTTTNASCGANNGSATVAGIGGTGPYTYSWTTPNLGTTASQTGLSPGTYAVTIKDLNGCTGNSKVVILGFSSVTAQVVPFDVSCFGANDGSINITPLAGKAPFTYSWSPNISTGSTASGLAPGTYCAVITDAGGCTGTVCATISQPTQVVASITSSVTTVTCGQFGSATVGATGGYLPYTYSWTSGTLTPTATNLAVGPHVVTVTDAFGCKDTVHITVTCASTIKAVFISSDTTFCNEAGMCIDFFDQSTGTPTSWKWTFQGAQPDTSTQQNPIGICYYNPGSYTVKLVVTNSNGTDSMTVAPLIIFATGALAPTITLSNDTLFSSHASAYQWYYNGSPILGATDSFYVAALGGDYNVYITDDNGCSRLGNAVTWSIVNGINQPGQIEIYPNPAGDQFTVYGLQFTANERKLEMYNALGESVYNQKLETGNSKQETVINVSSFSNGVYTLRILSGNESLNKKVIVVHK